MTNSTNPFLSANTNTGQIMMHVVFALIPGIIALTWVFGVAVLVNIVLAVLFAILLEALILHLRNKPVLTRLRDYSALVSAVLLAISLPPLTPWWMTAIGIFFAIVVAKQLYGGLGYNLFNPAMVGYAVLIISFPLQMTMWPDIQTLPGSFETILHWQFLSLIPDNQLLDAITQATPLDQFRSAQRSSSEHLSIDQLTVIEPQWLIINTAWLIGGLWLILRGLAAWQLPVTFLLGFTLLAGLAWIYAPDQYPAPWFHVFHGSLVITAFFILTDPVTAPISTRGRVIAAFLTAFLVFIIRYWGGYPDGSAFAILLMNMTVPLIDRYC